MSSSASSSSTVPAPVVAVLYQFGPAPAVNGIRKPTKPGGYADSGADIAFALRNAGVKVVLPVSEPDALKHRDWVWPDSAEGIAAAIEAGATVLWANTVVYASHPLASLSPAVHIVGQELASVERFDDKFATNQMLRDAKLPCAASILLTMPEVDASTVASLATAGLHFPLVIKPVRGRGSQGVTVVHSLAEFHSSSRALLTAVDAEFGGPLYGNALMVEPFLCGEEVTLSIMPPGRYTVRGGTVDKSTHWSLVPVRRIGHRDGVAPYNGVVAVSKNSVALTAEEAATPSVQALCRACEAAARLVGARSVIRIDARQVSADPSAPYLLFDLNMKPNLTGPGRPGRDDQDCLTSIAARGSDERWNYPELLVNLLAQAWASASSDKPSR